MATISDLGPKKVKLTTKHKVKIEVFVDGKKLCYTENVRDDRKKGGIGIGMEPDVLKEKDRDYVREALVKSANTLIKYAEYVSRNC